MMLKLTLELIKVYILYLLFSNHGDTMTFKKTLFLFILLILCCVSTAAADDTLYINEYTLKPSFAGCYIHSMSNIDGVYTFDIYNTNAVLVTGYVNYVPGFTNKGIESNPKQFPIKIGNNHYKLTSGAGFTIGAYTPYLKLKGYGNLYASSGDQNFCNYEYVKIGG